ncbi:MAG TPA: acylneuraminate cytidylyltransferase family protein [Sedimentisphaerales bacterium]|nr:acylneuraminate cytidylyltransferase family protein [Sedimentisphaerales bacterium]
MEVLGIIGARAGSKGLPGKNVRPLLGRPLLSYAIETAKRCRWVRRVILSTDSEEYAAIGRQYGAATPFLRPAQYASDTAIELGYIRHALEWLEENEGYRPDLVVRLCPTTPLIRSEDVDRCIEILMGDASAESAIIMTPAREHPRKTVKVAPDGVHVVSYVTERGSDVAPSNRQSYAAAYNRESLPVVSRRDTILQRGSQTGEIVRYHIVAQETALDIDTDFDFRIVETLLAQQNPHRELGRETSAHVAGGK